MFNKINEVQRQYTSAVQPVQLFETKNNKPTKDNNPFAFIDEMKQNGYNPFHPSVVNSEKGKKLDLMG